MLAKIETFKNPYMLALQSEKIVERKASDCLKDFSDILSKVYFEAGQKSDEATLTALCISLRDEVKKYFPYLRMDELKIALSNGVRGEYRGERDSSYIGLNIASFHGWIKGYIADQRRIEARKALAAAKERTYAPVLTPEQADLAWKETITAQFKKFKEGGHLVIQFPTHLFSYFEKNGKIKLSDAEKKVVFEKAKAEVIASKRQQRLVPRNKAHLHALSDFIKRAETNQLRAEEQAEIKQHARYLAIKQYYESINSTTPF